jgi:NADH-quinone oxidoreductase subunit C
LSSADNEGQAPEDPTTTSVEPPAGATPAEQEASLTPEAAVPGQAQTPADEVAAEPEPEPDPVRQPLLDSLRAELGDDLVGAEIAGGDIWVRVARSAWRKAGEVCKSRLGMDYFCFLSGMDWLPNPELSGEKVWDPDTERAEQAEAGEALPPTYETGVAGGDTRFQIFARLSSTTSKVGITLKADLDEADPRIESWIPVYRGADWHEREIWEMYGFQFDGHPDLRHIYLPAEFEGFPLRKDFPLLARELKPWPGLVDKEPIPGEEEEADATAGGET